MRRSIVLSCFTIVLVGQACRSADAALVDIVLDFDVTVTASQQVVFNTAASTIESILVEYTDPFVTSGFQVTINASTPFIDGAGMILGSAGPDNIFRTNPTSTWYTFDGSMRFDSADVANLEANNTFDDVVLHEMMHVMGFGTLWELNGLYSAGTGEYTGANALAQWQTEFGQAGDTFVPVELGGGAGTANGHWNEVDGGAGNTGITDGMSRDMRYELMTGWLNAGGPGPFISNMTRAAFIDLGYNAQLDLLAVPEPTSMMLMTAAGMFGFLCRRRKSRKWSIEPESTGDLQPESASSVRC